MNLFILDRDPRVCAGMHCDRDVLSLGLALAQVLCSAHFKHGTLKLERGVWVTEKGHPTYAPYESIPDDDVVLWAAAAPGNYQFVRRMLHGALSEYQERWGNAAGKHHKTWSMYNALREAPRPLRASFLGKPLAMAPFVRRIFATNGELQQLADPILKSYADKLDALDIILLHQALYRERSRVEPPKYLTGNIPFFMK